MQRPLSRLPTDPHLRPAQQDEAPRLAALLTLAHPDAPVVAQTLQRQAGLRLPGEPFWQTVAERHGELVGLAETGVPRMDGHPGWFALTVRVHPHDEPLAAALADTLYRLAEAAALGFGATTLVSRVREGWWEQAFLEARGYAVHDRLWPSTLDLRTLDFTRFRPYEERAQAAGLRIRPLPELGRFDEARQRRLYALMAALLRDVPTSTPVSIWGFETWQYRFAEKLKHPEGLFVAVAPDGEWVGVSELHMVEEAHPGALHNGLTGVLAHWRGRGVAYALKLAAARAALERGFTHARTGNHSANAPMLAINERLGFVRGAAWLTMMKGVQAASADAQPSAFF